MADVKISALPAATTPLGGTELVPIVQGGVTTRVSVDNLTAGRTVAASTVNVDANTASAAVRITQTGAGNALVVEDEANPDATPFVVNTVGRLLIGATAQQGVGGFNPFIQNHRSDGTGQFQWSNDVGAAKLWFAKSRSTTVGTQTIVQSGDQLSRISVYGSDGVAFIQASEIRTEVDGTPGLNDMPGRLVFSTTADGASTPTERMRITNAGNVGIGTGATSPTARLNVVDSTSQDAVRITQTGAGNALVVEDEANPDATPFVVTAAGDVGIGTSGPSAPLTVKAESAGYVGIRVLEAAGVAGSIQFVNDPVSVERGSFIATASGNMRMYGASTAEFYTGALERMRIDASGNLLLGGTASPTTGTQSLTVETGTAPTATPADTISVYSSDLSAGNTILSVYTEGAGATNAGITNTTVTNKIAVCINGTVYYLLATTNGT